MGSDDDTQPGFLGTLKNVLTKNKRPVSGEEFKEFIDDNVELLEDEKRMIGDILALDELSAGDIMQPRVDVMAIQDSATGRAALDRMRGTGYSRLPVFHEDLDHIVGIVRFKDLVEAVLSGADDNSVEEFMDEPFFVPETKDLLPLLSEMQEMRRQMAIVVDEYGGTAGLITVEDIVEEIVGEIVDETDSDAPAAVEVAPGLWQVDGRLPIKEAVELGIPLQESDDFETVAGWLIETFGTVPKVGDEFKKDGFKFQVRAMRRRRIQSIQIELEKPEAEADESDGPADAVNAEES